MYKKSQAATEYIIILAMVIIISLIVVSTLGGLPSFGTSNRIRVSAAYWQNADIAIVSYAMSTNEVHKLVVQNRLRNVIQINQINLSLNGYSEPEEFHPGGFNLGPGQRREISVNEGDFQICSEVGDVWVSNVKIKYTVDEIGSTHIFTGDGNKLEGRCAN
ncbi:MAG: hypothetical protein ACMXX8_00855 [Candidatus Woesearchaeota archaeon]